MQDTPDIKDLRASLRSYQTDSPETPSGPSETDVSAMANAVNEWADYSMPTQGVRNIFQNLAPGFDFDAWAQRWVDEGTFDPELLKDWTQLEIDTGSRND